MSNLWDHCPYKSYISSTRRVSIKAVSRGAATLQRNQEEIKSENFIRKFRKTPTARLLCKFFWSVVNTGGVRLFTEEAATKENQ